MKNDSREIFPCPKCGGLGYLTRKCHKCNGKGTIRVHDGDNYYGDSHHHTYDCKTCKGTGRIKSRTCPVCEGSKYVYVEKAPAPKNKEKEK